MCCKHMPASATLPLPDSTRTSIAVGSTVAKRLSCLLLHISLLAASCLANSAHLKRGPGNKPVQVLHWVCATAATEDMPARSCNGQRLAACTCKKPTCEGTCKAQASAVCRIHCVLTMLGGCWAVQCTSTEALNTTLQFSIAT